jgi:ribosome-associated protein
VLTPEQKEMIMNKLAGRINAEGMLRIESQEARTQLQNKKKVNEKFLELIYKSLQRKKKRIPSAVPENVKQDRMKAKRKVSEKKELRRPEWHE